MQLVPSCPHLNIYLCSSLLLTTPPTHLMPTTCASNCALPTLPDYTCKNIVSISEIRKLRFRESGTYMDAYSLWVAEINSVTLTPQFKVIPYMKNSYWNDSFQFRVFGGRCIFRNIISWCHHHSCLGKVLCSCTLHISLQEIGIQHSWILIRTVSWTSWENFLFMF